MIFDSISPTFNIPEAAQYFEISMNDGKDYIPASTIILNYYALNKMSNFTKEANILNLLFRKNDTDDPRDYRITKILVNEASTFNEDDYGENVINYGEQEEGDYLAGKYVTYNNVINGGVNFSDFKIASINNTDMQMIFYVSPMAGMPITIKSYSASSNGTTLNVYLNIFGNTTSIEKTIHLNETLNFYVHCEFITPDLIDKTYSFEYGVTKYDVLGSDPQLPPNPTQIGAQEWNINIQEIIWTAEPLIEIKPIRFSVTGKQTTETEEYDITVEGLARFDLIDEKWTWTGEIISGTFVVYEYEAEYASTGEMKTCWRVKDYHEGPAAMYGFDKVEGASLYYKNYYASYP